MLDIKKGQKVTLVVNRQRSETKIVDAIVEKVGRKYFYLNTKDIEGVYINPETRFDLQTGRAEFSYNNEIIVYTNKQEYLDKIEKTELSDYFKRDVFGGYGELNISLDCLRELKQVLDKHSVT